MRKVRPIDSLLTPIRQAILFATYSQSDRWWYLSELAASAGTGPSSLQRELSTFVANGILERKRDGGRIYFKASTNSPLFGPLKELLEQTLGPIGALREAIESIADRISFAFIFGSFARREESARSDVDVMIIGDLGLGDLVRTLKPLELRFGREFNARCYSVPEFKEKLDVNNHFVRAVMRGPKIFLIGDENELERLAGKPLDS